ncbi:MAG TPA: peroxide stress protein YaaA [Flavobacteriales bacterium]|nr:peroxide stress protein YaaA [Flavobacteriales bacterium]
MLTFLSPAKSLNFEIEVPQLDYSQPLFKQETAKLVEQLKQLSAADIKNLMHVSDNIAQLNYERYKNFRNSFQLPYAKPAALVFTGEVYKGLHANDYTAEDWQFAQEHLRILSGLYGMLRPLDLIQPYRLEMGTKFSFNGYKNLYEYWKEKVTEEIKKELSKQENPVIINLASAEYFKVIDKKILDTEIITPVFKDNKNGTYKTIMMYAKNARGKMASFIVKNKITNPEHLKAFDEDGYIFNKLLSGNSEWVFTRG